ncbi:hypothetical protein [Bremerella cremea]|uniref:hypothetical protein n=1 Tax=Bremerella cremea TaxID=1031537 RepID=UPI0031ECA48D
MKTKLRTWFPLVAVIAVAGFLGCSSEPAGPKVSAGGEEEHGHSHGPGEHDHDHGEEGHGHAPGPHGGTLADWGGGTFHVEFTVDHAQKQATVYILGGDEKTPSPIDAESVLLTIQDPAMQIDLAPQPLADDPAGEASRFVGTNEGLATVKEYAGTLSAAVDSTPYAGNFQEEASGHAHEHSHGPDDALVWEGEPKQHAGMTIKLGHHGSHLHKGKKSNQPLPLPATESPSTA